MSTSHLLLSITLSIWFAEWKRKFVSPNTHVNMDECFSPYPLTFHHRSMPKYTIFSWLSQEVFKSFSGSCCHHSTLLSAGRAGGKVFPEHYDLPDPCTATPCQKWKLSFLVRCGAVPRLEFRVQDLVSNLDN